MYLLTVPLKYREQDETQNPYALRLYFPLPPSPVMTDTPTSNASTLWQGRDIQDHVVVAQAEDDFGQVQQSLSTPKAAGRVAFRDSSPIDLEKGHEEDRREAFDLREYLTSSNDANSAAGIKHKHVGVTWEDLEVSGIGGEENKVRDCVRYLLRLSSHGLFSLDIRVYIRGSVISMVLTASF